MAVGLLLGTGVEGTRAVLNQESSPFHANVEVASIDVALLENGSLVANNGYNGGNPSGELKLPEIVDGKAKLGYKYPEELSVQNTGSISQFVRVTVLKYWKEKGSDKRIDLDPSYIVLEETNDGWVKDANASTSEREVFYYLPVLEPGQTTPALSSTLSISPEVLNKKQRRTIHTMIWSFIWKRKWTRSRIITRRMRSRVFGASAFLEMRITFL